MFNKTTTSTFSNNNKKTLSYNNLLQKPLTFPNKSKLSNLLRTPINPNSPSKPLKKPLKSNSISYSNGSSILVFGSNPSIIQINNYLPNKSNKLQNNEKISKNLQNLEKCLKINSLYNNQDHKRTFTSENAISNEKDSVNVPFSARNDSGNTNNPIFDHKGSLPNLEILKESMKKMKTFDKFGINLKALMKMRNNPKFCNLNKNVSKNIIIEKKPLEKNDIMGELLQRTRKLLEFYKGKEKKWIAEREKLKNEIELLRNHKE